MIMPLRLPRDCVVFVLSATYAINVMFVFFVLGSNAQYIMLLFALSSTNAINDLFYVHVAD